MYSVPKSSLRAVIAVLAFIGLAGVLPVSYSELSTQTACPHLGFIPACHIVTLAYAIVLLTAVHSRIWKTWLFVLGWLPIFLLALAGTTLELLGNGTCPETAGGIPKCYFSLGLAIALVLPVLIHIVNSRHTVSTGSHLK